MFDRPCAERVWRKAGPRIAFDRYCEVFTRATSAASGSANRERRDSRFTPLLNRSSAGRIPKVSRGRVARPGIGPISPVARMARNNETTANNRRRNG
jgi:hypothetical protein